MVCMCSCAAAVTAPLIVLSTQLHLQEPTFLQKCATCLLAAATVAMPMSVAPVLVRAGHRQQPLDPRQQHTEHQNVHACRCRNRLCVEGCCLSPQRQPGNVKLAALAQAALRHCQHDYM